MHAALVMPTTQIMRGRKRVIPCNLHDIFIGSGQRKYYCLRIFS